MKIMQQLLRAVCYMHGRDIVHRDLKPENIILQTKEPISQTNMKLIDFGLARRARDDEVMRSLVGTTFYVAPEVALRSYTKVCEYWSCGVLMYLMLSGTLPFQGVNDRKVLEAIKEARYVLDGRLWDPVSEPAKCVLRRLLEKDPSKRITADRALEDEWFAMDLSKGNTILHADLVDNLRRFGQTNRFQQIAVTAVAHQLPEEQISKLRATFIAMDKDNDGSLSLEEMHKGMCTMVANTKDLTKIMEEMDFNHDGHVSYTEFLAATMDRLGENEALCWRAFKAFDLDGDGFITLEELRQVLADDDIKSELDTHATVEELFKDMDLDGDRKVNFLEFKAMMIGGTPQQRKATVKALTPKKKCRCTVQ